VGLCNGNGLTRSRCDADFNHYDTLLAIDNTAWISGFGIAALGACFGAYWLLRGEPSPPPTARSSGPNITPRLGLGWAAIEGSF
jgi:hypothetical protein